MIKFLIEKEFKQLLRNPIIPRLIIIFPCMMMILMPWAANLEIKNNNLCIVDNDRSPYSEKLSQKVSSSEYFRLTCTAGSYREALEMVETGKADIILEIPARFEQDLIKEGNTRVMICANAVNGTKGGLGSSYLASIVTDFAAQMPFASPGSSGFSSGSATQPGFLPGNSSVSSGETFSGSLPGIAISTPVPAGNGPGILSGPSCNSAAGNLTEPAGGFISGSSWQAAPGIEISIQNLFNPHLNYKVFMVPALLVMLLTMLCGFLPALNIVGEKETGTIEQINVTPVGKFTFILAKLIPYWIVGIIVLSICILLASLLYGITPAGQVGILYFFSCLFILVVSGFGLIISNYSSTMQQSMFVMFFFMIILILMSGLFTPISSMPRWAQIITLFNPLTYFIEVMRMVFLKGSGLFQLGIQFFALCGFAVFFNTWAILSYRKRG